jgi:hypothetical protein
MDANWRGFYARDRGFLDGAEDIGGGSIGECCGGLRDKRGEVRYQGEDCVKGKFREPALYPV